jgi:hypothetical protein
LKDRDKISYYYHRQVEDILDNQSDLKFFDPLNREELEEIWEDMSVRMDIDEVWSSISSDLDQVMPVSAGTGIIVKSVAIFIVVLTAIIPARKEIIESGNVIQDVLIVNNTGKAASGPDLFDKGQSTSAENRLTGVISPSLESTSTRCPDSKTILPSAEGVKEVSKKEMPEYPGKKVYVNDLTVSEKNNQYLIAPPCIMPPDRSVIRPASIPGDIEKIDLVSGSSYGNLKISSHSSGVRLTLPSFYRGRVSGGLITVFRNTWLLNHETIDGLRPESLTTTNIIFFPDIGLSMTYSLNRTWALQGDLFLYSGTGQEYHAYIYGHYSRKEIILRYTTTALSAKYKFSSGKDNMSRVSLNLIGGCYFSFLQNAYRRINEDIEKIGSEYDKLDFGIRLGSEVELNICDNFSVAPGLFFSLGLNNISRGISNVPDFTGKTHNLSEGFHLSFYYRFK